MSGQDSRKPFVCPRCAARSWHPVDKQEGYCGRCKAFTAPPASSDTIAVYALLAR
ncbi:hypothetical protein [Micromonospora sp. WMMC273]|uniref:hypothetical protein n=1 Tax=Micromonospora sp. WMMC273 TaxID=3015157 RepID=UPI0022B751DC|nr:hypothetical protein [Micromonospora sp. WMMC273]MCZ7478834.1 hypothetical protein [Micromonospora sp. WMMC273]MCZ7478962.1 hypothetical protein [Micromonospora sp. WMMC273]MCZ7479010.1 hypothetical protein [Micromonospora sp. WMMC273]